MRRLEFIYEFVCDKNQTTTGERKEMDLFSSLRLFLEDFVCKFLNSESISKTQEAREREERGRDPPTHSAMRHATLLIHQNSFAVRTGNAAAATTDPAHKHNMEPASFPSPSQTQPNPLKLIQTRRRRRKGIPII